MFKPKNQQVILAPLAGCSDLAFRLIAREHGAKLCFYEMVDSNALINSNPLKTQDILQKHKKDKPIAAQILGGEPEKVLKAAKLLMEMVNIKFLDVNAACPVKKVLKKKAGAQLLTDPERLCDIIKVLSENIPVPITVKLRTTNNIVQIAKDCKKAGVKTIFIHGRSKEQGYAGEVDYASIKAVKKAVKIPVYGSGNIFNPELAKQMLDLTGCDGILVARGAMGNPWIFKQIEDYLRKGKYKKEITLKERLKVLKKHLSYLEKYKLLKSHAKMGHMIKVAIWYLKSLPNAKEIRKKIVRTSSYDSLLDLISTL